MKTLFLTGFFPEQIKDEIITNSKSNVQNAANVLQQGLVEGLTYHLPKMDILNFPFVGSFPVRYRKIWVPSCNFSTDNGLKKSVGYFNFTYIKKHIIFNKIKSEITKWENKSHENTVIVYSANYLKPIADLKRKGGKFNICLILPDLVEHFQWGKGIFYDYYKKSLVEESYKNYKLVDRFVFLTKHMNECVNINKKPWTVIEGIYKKGSYKDRKEDSSLKNQRYILYSGSLAFRHGIMNLVEAFLQANIKNVFLVICGNGEASHKLKKTAEQHSTVMFKGLVSREDAIQLQKKATLLVNPRLPENLYTKFSFPSKIMEYFGSGTPCLMYKLLGIPEEYYNYCFTVDDPSITALKNMLISILSLKENELKEIGAKAQKFVKEQKAPIVQCKKIVDIL